MPDKSIDTFRRTQLHHYIASATEAQIKELFEREFIILEDISETEGEV